MLESIILGMVLEKGMTGYDIKKTIENGIGVFYKASYGSLYPALKRLTEKGFVSTLEKPQGARQKIFYYITDAGKKRFYDWLAAPIDIFEGTNAHLAKVYFFDKLAPDIRARQLLEFEINYVNYLRKLEALEKGFSGLDNEEQCYFKLSTLYYGISMTQQIIAWCRHIRTGKPLPELIQPQVRQDGSGG